MIILLFDDHTSGMLHSLCYFISTHILIHTDYNHAISHTSNHSIHQYTDINKQNPANIHVGSCLLIVSRSIPFRVLLFLSVSDITQTIPDLNQGCCGRTDCVTKQALNACFVNVCVLWMILCVLCIWWRERDGCSSQWSLIWVMVCLMVGAQSHLFIHCVCFVIYLV